MEIQYTKCAISGFTKEVDNKDKFIKIYLGFRTSGEINKEKAEGKFFRITAIFSKWGSIGSANECHGENKDFHHDHKLSVFEKTMGKQNFLDKLFDRRIEPQYDYLEGEIFTWNHKDNSETFEWPHKDPNHSLWNFPLIITENEKEIVFGVSRKNQVMIYKWSKFGLQLISYTKKIEG